MCQFFPKDDLSRISSDYDRLKADYHQVDEELRALKAEARSNGLQLEAAFERTNQMLVETQLDNIELVQIFNAALDGMWVIDTRYRVRRINRALQKLLNLPDGNAEGQYCYDLFPGPSCQTDQCTINRMINGEKYVECDVEYTLDGTTRPYILTASPLMGPDRDLVGVVETFKDITDRKEAEMKLQQLNRKLEHLATVDGLTEVANRREFNRFLEQEWYRLRRSRKPLSLIMCDVDYFKRYNDSYGHQLGDECLRSIAAGIRLHLKRPADFVARYGGEEFVVILPETDESGAVHVAELVRTEIENLKIPHESSPICPHVTLSLGTSSIVPDSGHTPGEVVDFADKALYRAKAAGRNRVASKTIRPMVLKQCGGIW